MMIRTYIGYIYIFILIFVTVRTRKCQMFKINLNTLDSTDERYLVKIYMYIEKWKAHEIHELDLTDRYRPVGSKGDKNGI